MRVAKDTITAIQKIVTGDPISTGDLLAPYQSGPELVDFFNQFGFDDEYSWGGGFPSRWDYCESRLEELNGTSEMTRVIEAAVDPRRYLDTEYDVEKAVNYLNRYLKYDGFKIRMVGDFFKVFGHGDKLVGIEAKLDSVSPSSREFIAEQIEKCRRKIREEDYDGAITNARSLVEAVLLDIETRITGGERDYDGDLNRLYKRVRNLMNLDPRGKRVDEILLPITTGFTSIISGLAGTRNKMSDAHARTYRPYQHHARLAVNSAQTLVDFLVDSLEYQRERGLLLTPDDEDAAG